jgi:adenylylsulfate kinase
MQRDPKGLYKRALCGKIKNFTGLNAPFEIPELPDLILKTDKLTPEACIAEILNNFEIQNQ